jgi:hypothetical protein
LVLKYVWASGSHTEICKTGFRFILFVRYASSLEVSHPVIFSSNGISLPGAGNDREQRIKKEKKKINKRFIMNKLND